MSKSIGLLSFGFVAAFAMLVVPGFAQKTDNKDVGFMQEAAMGGVTEVQLGQLALQKASNNEVKQFAQRMIDDHSKGNNELMQLAKSRNVVLPQTLDAKHKNMQSKLSQLQGQAFDKEYMRHMVEDHEEVMGQFQQASKFVQDPELKGWVMKQLPVLDEHLRLAKDIHGKVEKASK